jgi:hypothetical protein
MRQETQMFRYGLLALLIAFTAAAGLASAQSKKGSNGGMVVTSHGHPIEFVLKGQELVFYVSDDDGSPLSTKEMRGRATVQDGGRTATVPLQPAAPNMMIGKLQAALGSKARVVFSANLHGHSLVARYVTE